MPAPTMPRPRPDRRLPIPSGAASRDEEIAPAADGAALDGCGGYMGGSEGEAAHGGKSWRQRRKEQYLKTHGGGTRAGQAAMAVPRPPLPPSTAARRAERVP